MSTARPDGMLVQNGRGLVDWLTGTGFLTLNALCFFGALVTLIPWNIYSDPGDFWSADILIRWAFLLGFHALLVGTWSLIRNVILKDDNPVAQMTPTARQWHNARARNTASSIDFRAAPTHGPSAAAAATTLYAEEWARQSFEQTSDTFETREEPEADASPASASLGDLLADWDTSWPEPLVAQDTRQRAASINAEGQADSPPDVDILIGGTAPERTPGPLSAAARASGEDSAVDPELEWQWIEAAASAWLTRREHEPGATQPGGNLGH